MEILSDKINSRHITKCLNNVPPDSKIVSIDVVDGEKNYKRIPKLLEIIYLYKNERRRSRVSFHLNRGE